MTLRWIATRLALAILSASTGVVGVYATAGLLDAQGNNGNRRAGNTHCDGEQCCFVCGQTAGSSSCIPVEWKAEMGDYNEYCTGISHTLGGGGTYFTTRGGCQSSAQCNAGNIPNCADGFDNDFDMLTDNADPDCAKGMWENTFNGKSDVSLRITGPEQAKRGDTATYRVILKNTGNTAVDSVDIFGTFGLNFEVVDYDNNSCVILQQTFSCYGLRVDSNREKTVEFKMKILDEQPACGARTPSVYVSALNASNVNQFSQKIEGEFRTFISCEECSDGIDNDGNGRWDFPFDDGCSSPQDTEEKGGTQGAHFGTIQPNTNGHKDSNTLSIPPPRETVRLNENSNKNDGTTGNSTVNISDTSQRNVQRFVAPFNRAATTRTDTGVTPPKAENKEEQRIERLQNFLKERQLRNAVNSVQLLEESQTFKALGCFTPEGAWTQNRSLCDNRQEKHVADVLSPLGEQISFRKPDAAVYDSQAEKEMRNALRRRFVGNQHYTNILGILYDLRTRLNRMRTIEYMDENSTQYVQDSQAWVESEIRIYTTQNFSMENIDATVHTAQSLIPRLEALSKQPEYTPAIQDIIKGIEGLLAKTYDAFQILFAKQIFVHTDIIGDYQRASSLFVDVQSRCYSDKNACGDLKNVLGIIEPMLQNLQNVVRASGDTSAQESIRSIFER